MRRVLVVGAGSIGERHLRCFQRTGRCAVLVCDSNRELLETVSERYGISERFTDISAALNAGTGAAIICTPAHLHVPMAAECVRKEVPVLIEKPLSTDLKGVAELRSATFRRKVAVSVAYVHRANPIFSAFREAVQSGRFGIPVEVVATAGQHFPHYRPAYREIYYRDRSTGGGAVQDALTHLANALEWVVGPVRELVADLDHQVLEGVEVEDTVHVLTRHARGVMGSLQLNQHQAPNEFILTVHCTKGSVRLELHENRWRWMEHPQTPWNDALGVPLERDDLFIRQAHAFLDTCETGRAPLCSLEEGEQSLRFNLGVLESAQKRAWVTLT